MDIIVGSSEKHLKSIMSPQVDFTKNPGAHIYFIKRKPLLLRRGERMYFCYDKKIYGYGITIEVERIDNDLHAAFAGRLWKYKGKYAILWKESNWYKRGIYCNVNIKFQRYKYFKLKKLLNGLPEPEIVKRKELTWT